MKSSLKLGKILGIPVRVHWTMLFLVMLLSWGGGFLGLTSALVSLGLLFASIVAHELSHALAARRYGIATTEILLMPLGGVAKIAGQPANGKQEVVIALAGPAMSLALAGLAAIGAAVTAPVPPLHAAMVALASANLMLGLFNLLPAFPMDGGRVLRGLLRERSGLVKATRTAAKVARWIAVPMAIAGIALGNPSLVLVAGFVWLTARSEERLVEGGGWSDSPIDPRVMRVDASGWMPPRHAEPTAPRGYVVRVGPHTYVRVMR
ncbi:Putative zinc metalloprotease [Minicystis rosea]|nr:Putative zinc metalloprotease [Minicystis rosea]